MKLKQKKEKEKYKKVRVLKLFLKKVADFVTAPQEMDESEKKIRDIY